MELFDTIKARRSVRTFDGRMVSTGDKIALTKYLDKISNPYGIPVEFLFLDAGEYGLSSPVIKGEKLYIAAKAPRVEHMEEAYGYSFEMMVLYAWSIGIGTTWIGGTFDRERFEKAADVGADECMPIASPLGYASDRMSVTEKIMRRSIKADQRKNVSELFFEESFDRPMTSVDDALEAVRLAPSAVNLQPWRVVRTGGSYHFFKKQQKDYVKKVGWDVQKIDMGIALCHFMMMTGGEMVLSEPDIAVPDDMEYIATVELR